MAILQMQNVNGPDDLNSSQKTHKNSTLEFLALEGAWIDDRQPEEIIDDIRRTRSQSSSIK